MTYTVYMDKQRRSYIALGAAGKRGTDTALLTLAGGQVGVVRYPSAMLGHIGLAVHAACPQHAAEIYARSELRKTAPALAALREILGSTHPALMGVTSIDGSDTTEVVKMHYIFSKAGEFMSSHKNAKEAEGVLGKLPEDARLSAVIVASPEGLAQFSVVALTTLHNDHAAEDAHVPKFKDKATGTVKAWDALQQTFDPAVIKAAEKVAKEAAKQAEKDAKAAAKAEQQTAKQAKKDAKAAAKAANGGTPSTRGPRTTYSGKTITMLNATHGARAGSKRATGMDILIASKTTDQALEAFKAHPGIDATFIRFAVDTGLIALS